uniref:Uncharacterized protein n=1 Tax=Romanomermis culicivorax TaxID=13658 RepID=A0A915IV70_ROMCU
MKHAFDNKTLTLSVCGQIKVTNSTIVQAHGPVIINIESELGNYPVRYIDFSNDTQDQFNISTNFFAYPKINAMLNFKDEFIKIGNKRLLL